MARSVAVVRSPLACRALRVDSNYDPFSPQRFTQWRAAIFGMSRHTGTSEKILDGR